MRKYTLGIVGCGCVGEAIAFSYERLTHKVIRHDIKLGTDIKDTLVADIIFICVPTPSLPDGKCNISIVESVVDELNNLEYKGVVCIKSTVTPGTTKRLQEKYPALRIAFCPEFLKERIALYCATTGLKLLAIGTECPRIFRLIKNVHGHYPQNVVQLTPTQAELLKISHNNINTLRVIWAIETDNLCKALGEEWTPIKNALLKSSSLPDEYLDSGPAFRAVSGICLPKDLAATVKLIDELGVDSKLLHICKEQNDKWDKTVFPGMRAS